MIVTAFSSLPPVAVVVVVMLLLSCCAGIRVYPAPQITVARVTVTSARCCTQNLESTGQGLPLGLFMLQDKREEEEHEEHDVRDTTAGGGEI